MHELRLLGLAGLLALGACEMPGGPSAPGAASAPSGSGRASRPEPSVDAAAPRTSVSTSIGARPLYLMVVDRFFDGDPSNDDLGAPGCLDRSNPRKFHGGDLAGVRAKIGYLGRLGIGTVWTTPLALQIGEHDGACGYHGYWADLALPDDGAIEPKLGTRADATTLRDALHGAGMWWMMDMVVNHAGFGARIQRQRPDWFHPQDGCDKLGSPVETCPLSGLPDFAQENDEAASYLDASSLGWLTRLRPDAIRMDTEKHVPTSYFAKRWVPAVRAAKSDLFLLAEHYDDGDIATYAPTLNAGFDSAFHFPLRSALVRGFMQRGGVDDVATVVQRTVSTLGIERARSLVTFIDNHDTPRILSEAPSMPDGELEARYMATLVALFTLPGVPQIYAGDELGMKGGADPDNRRDMPAWAWEADSRRGRHDGFVGDSSVWFDAVASLAELRSREPALRDGSYTELWRKGAGSANVLVFFRGAGASRVLVVISLDPQAFELDVPFASSGVAPADRAAWPDGTHLVLASRGVDGAPSELVVDGGALRVKGRGIVAAVYRPRP